MRAALFALLLVTGVAHAQVERYIANGTVISVDRDLSRITIDTDAIEALKLPALALAFSVHDRNLLDRVRTGRKVEFEFVKQGRNFVLVRLLKNVP